MRIKTNFYLKTNCLIMKKCRGKQCKIALNKAYQNQNMKSQKKPWKAHPNEG